MAFEPFLPPPKRWASPSAGLTERQLRGIGAVVSAWAVLEAVIQNALVRLAQSPMTLGQALTEDLGPDNRLKALKRLCDTWLIIMRVRSSELAEVLDEMNELRLWVEQKKGLRNQIAHWQWFRQTDEKMFGMKYSTRPQTQEAQKQSCLSATPEDFWEFAEEINLRTDQMIELVRDLKRLPSWPEK